MERLQSGLWKDNPGLVQLLGRDLEHPLQDLALEEAVGGDARAAP